MADATLLTEITAAMLNGIQTSSAAKLEGIYRDYDNEFKYESSYKARFAGAFNIVTQWEELHDTTLMKPFNFYSLCLAIMHAEKPVKKLGSVVTSPGRGIPDADIALSNLSTLCQAVDNNAKKGKLGEFVIACSEATNTEGNRKTRFRFLFNALRPKPL